MAVLYVTNYKNLEKEEVDLSRFRLIFLVDKSDKRAKKIAKEGRAITAFEKNGDLLYSNILKEKSCEKNVNMLGYVFYKKYISAVNFSKKKDLMENPDRRKSVMDKNYYNFYIRPVYDALTSNNLDKEYVENGFLKVNDMLYESVCKLMSYQLKDFEKLEKHFYKAFKIYRNILYSMIMSEFESEFADFDVCSTVDSYLFWTLVDLFVNYGIDRGDIKRGEFSEDFLKILFRIFNEKINHGSYSEIRYYIDLSIKAVEGMYNGTKSLRDVL